MGAWVNGEGDRVSNLRAHHTGFNHGRRVIDYSDGPDRRRLHARTHDDAVPERGPVLELQGLEYVPELLRHGCGCVKWQSKSKVKFNHTLASDERGNVCVF